MTTRQEKSVVTLSAEEKAELQRAADAKSLKLAVFLRMKGLEAAREMGKE